MKNFWQIISIYEPNTVFYFFLCYAAMIALFHMFYFIRSYLCSKFSLHTYQTCAYTHTHKYGKIEAYIYTAMKYFDFLSIVQLKKRSKITTSYINN